MHCSDVSFNSPFMHLEEDYTLFRRMMKAHLSNKAAPPSDILFLGTVYKFT